MKKKIVFLQSLYYLLIPCVFLVFFYGASLLIPGNAGFGTVVTSVYGILFIGTPLVVAFLMRFSLLRWYVDPFAAVEIPLVYYIMMLVRRIQQGNHFSAAFFALNHSLVSEGWLFLAGLFLFGLIASISPARKAGKNMLYTWIRKP